MAAFAGQYTHTLDQKNRLSVPARLREELGESFVLYMPGNGDRCIFAYTIADWQEVLDKLNDRPASKELTNMQRFVHFNSDRVDIDKQGRFTIKQNFLDFAGLKKDVFLLGAGRRIEIWDTDEWSRMLGALESNGEMPTFDLAF